jgi:hypothetical protein
VPAPRSLPVHAIRRHPVEAEAVIGRPRGQIWNELEDPAGHPAWADPPERRKHRRIEGTPIFVVGAAWVAVLPPTGLEDHRTVMYWEITAVDPGASVSTELLWHRYRYTEILTLRDTTDGGTHASVRGWLSAPADQPGDPGRIARGLALLARTALQRAAEWRPGDPDRSSAIPYDPSRPDPLA